MDASDQRRLALTGMAFIEDKSLRAAFPRSDYLNKEGKILRGLPADAYHMARYKARGFQPIPFGVKNEVPQADPVEPPAAPEVKSGKVLSPKRKASRPRKH